MDNKVGVLMKVFFKKFSKLKLIYKLMYLLITLLFLGSTSCFINSLLLLKGIETGIRIGIIVLFSIFLFLYILVSLLLLFTKKNKTFIFSSIFVFIISLVMIFLSFFIHKTYSTIDKMNEESITYSTSLITLKDNDINIDSVIGIIENEDDIEGYVLAKKLLKKENLENVKLIEYNNYLDMLMDLYDGVTNGILIGSNYVSSYSNYEVFQNIEKETEEKYFYSEDIKVDNTKNQKKLTEPFTVLLLGVDSETDGLKSNSSFNGDTMMLITFNPNTLNATVFSIPRDTYVPISCFGNNKSKINASASGGTDCVIKTIENLTDVPIDYYVKINFKGVVDLVDALEGVNVNVPIEFCEQDSNRNFVNQICLKTGEQVLNGEEALALARHRKTLLYGDFQRVQHQQLVVDAIMQKAKGIRSLNDFYEVLNAISSNIETNMQTETMMDFYNVGKNIFINSSIEKLNIEKTYLMGSDSHVFISSLNSNVYVFEYNEQSLQEIVDEMKINLELKEPEIIKSFNFSVNETYEVPVIGKKYLNN